MKRRVKVTGEPSVRQPAVAGLFYPADRVELGETVRAYLDFGSSLVGPDGGAGRRPGGPKAVVAPHAGYDYSGAIAGTAFAPLADAAATEGGRIRRIVLLGPAHRVPVRGLALPGASALATPLGEVEVDAELAARVEGLEQVTVNTSAHALEHSLEVELPFLQLLFEDVSLLPLVVGDAHAHEVAEVLDAVWGDEETRIVISSDLSHYLPYADAVVADRSTAERILALEPRLGPYDACGAFCINGLLETARRRGLAGELLDLRNSGDTAGDRTRVVGYGAFAFHEA